jgi:CheY-like chemotaxis protein
MTTNAEPIKILLVDDDPFIMGVMKGFLNSQSFKIDIAASGVEALALTKNKSYDCVVTDIRMPNGSGADLLASLREIDRRSPSVVCVSGAKDVSLDELLAKGADSFILKPFTDEFFVSEVNRLSLPLPTRLASKPAFYESLKEVRINGTGVLSTGTGGDVRLGHGGFFTSFHPERVRINQSLRFTLEIGKDQVLKGCGRIMWLRRASSLRPLSAGMGILMEYLEPKSLPKYLTFIEGSKIVETIPLDMGA